MDFQGPAGSVPALLARVRMPGNFDDRSAEAVFEGVTWLRLDDLRNIATILYRPVSFFYEASRLNWILLLTCRAGMTCHARPECFFLGQFYLGKF